MNSTDQDKRGGNPLDRGVRSAFKALDDASFPAPAALVVMGTGLGLLAERLEDVVDVELATIDGVPAPWSRAQLVAGRFGDLHLWLLEDLSLGDTQGGSDWQRAFPCWLAARAGARVLVLATAGASLAERIAPGALAVVTDHIDLGGTGTLRGLGASELGPLFPDQTRLHVESLRHEAVALGSEVGIDVHPAVAACVPGPHLETPAEARYWRVAGADVSVQGLGHLLAGAVHAGLGAVVFCAVSGRSGHAADLRRILEHAEKQAPALEDLILRMAGPIAEVAASLADEAELA
ncbi:purine-nucleoside phosphorylase [Planctomycetes bacterium Pla163]|uniref:phosphorylase family protein n=1 Tax=Rohdeia mirabilis TaxID=2528008 RepID=UPI0011A1C1F3